MKDKHDSWLLYSAAYSLLLMEASLRSGVNIGLALFFPSLIPAAVLGYGSLMKSRSKSGAAAETWASYWALFLPCLIVAWIPVHMVTELAIRLMQIIEKLA